MKITNVSIPKAYEDNGIEDIHMSKLGDVVLIAGKNGSGKTRLLKKIELAMKAKPAKSTIEEITPKKLSYEIELQKIMVDREYHQNKLTNCKDEVEIVAANNALESSKGPKQFYDYHLNGYNKALNWNLITTDIVTDYYNVIPFIPKENQLKDPNNFTKNQLIENADKISGSVGIGFLGESSLSKIQVIQDKWFNVTHQNSTVDLSQKNSIIQEYDSLKKASRNF